MARSRISATTSPGTRSSGFCTTTGSTRLPSGPDERRGRRSYRRIGTAWPPGDLFTVAVLTLASLKRYLVFFVIERETRRVTIAWIHPQTYGAWMEQLARNLTDPVEGCLRTASHLIHDRDPRPRCTRVSSARS